MLSTAVIKEKISTASATAVGVAVAVITTAMLTVSSTGVTVETADVTNVQTANGYFLTSSFEILDFLGTLAVLAGGLYVLNKIFSFVPKPGSNN